MTTVNHAVDVTPVFQNGLANGGPKPNPNPNNKKSKETERRRRRKQKKKKNKLQPSTELTASNLADSPISDTDSASHQALEQIEVKYVPEKAEFDDGYEEFKDIFEKFSLKELEEEEGNDKKDEMDQAAAAKKKDDSDSDDEEQETEQKEKGISNKKKKLQRRMKIAELKQVCRRPDVVEIWDATATDPKLLVFLKSYRNTVPVPRHWSQKRKYLQGSCCDNHGCQTSR